MSALTMLETELVKAHLAGSGLSNGLQEELLDHLCCAIEAALDQGISFELALLQQTAQWDRKHLRSIQRKTTFTTKIKPMLLKITTFSILIACLSLMTYSYADNSESRTQENLNFVPVKADLSPLVQVDSAGPPSASPLPGVALSETNAGFGERIHPLSKKTLFHRGIDFKAKMGTPVLATAAGTVIFAAKNGANGIQVILRHTGGYSTVYSHLNSHRVKVGQAIVLGQQIAEVGNTGQSTGPHLHYEIRKDKQPINPLAMLK